MDKERNLMCYLTSMKIIDRGLCEGLISWEKYVQIDTILADRFSIQKDSVWRCNRLLLTPDKR